MIRLAVAGLAHPHAAYVLKEIPRHPEVRLVAVSDSDRDQRARFVSDPAVRQYSGHQEMLAAEAPDVVAVAGVNADRSAVAIDAMRSGAHVLADKPLCVDLRQLADVQAAAADTGRIVSVMFEKRGYPVTLAARRVVEAGVLGEIALIASTGPHKLLRESRQPWFFDRARAGGIIGDLAVHDIDLINMFAGLTEGSVSGHASNLTAPAHPGFADAGALMMSSGAMTATIEVSWLSPAAMPYHGRYRMRLTGTSGTADLDWAEHRLEVVSNDRPPWLEPLPAGLRPAQEFLAAICAGRMPEVGTAQALLATRLALLGQRSADRDGIVERWTST